MQADNGGQVNLNGGSTKTPNMVTTIADGSIGLYAASAGVINVNGVTKISTGFVSEGTTGFEAYGVQADGVGSQVNLNAATTVMTVGDDAHGLYATSGGLIDASKAPTLGVTTYGDGAIGVYASGSGSVSDTVTPSTISIANATVVTHGDSAIGVLADTGGLVSMNGGSVDTYGGAAEEGPASIGVEANGAPSEVDLKGAVTVTTHATGEDGAGAYGLYAVDGGKIDGSTAMSVGVMTYGTGAVGVYASGADEFGNGFEHIHRQRDGSHERRIRDRRSGRQRRPGEGCRRFGQHLRRRVGRCGRDRRAGRRRGVQGDAHRGDDHRHERDRGRRAGAYGLYASNGGTIDGSAATSVGVTTYGTGAVGVYAHGTGTADDTVAASTITITGAKVITNGGSAIGVFADEGGLVTVNGGSVTTNGSTPDDGLAAIGVQADGVGSKVTLTGATTIATNATGSDGAGAHGLYASNGGTIDGSTATSVGVTTFGTGAIGVYASGSGTVSDTVTPSTITIAGATVITNGASATGVLADGGALATVNGGSVTTNGLTAIGVEANGTLSEVDLKGAITVATGTSAAAGAAYGLYATDGGKIDGSTATSVGVTTSRDRRDRSLRQRHG